MVYAPALTGLKLFIYTFSFFFSFFPPVFVLAIPIYSIFELVERVYPWLKAKLCYLINIQRITEIMVRPWVRNILYPIFLANTKQFTYPLSSSTVSNFRIMVCCNVVCIACFALFKQEFKTLS